MNRIISTLTVLSLFCITPIFSQSTLESLAIEHLRTIAAEKQYGQKDLADPLVTDSYTSRNVSHVYLKQQYEGIPIEHTNAGVHFANGNIIASNMDFVAGLERINIGSSTPVLTPQLAIAKLSLAKGYVHNPLSIQEIENQSHLPTRNMLLTGGDLSHTDIKVKLVYTQTQKEQITLAWDIIINEKQGADYLDFIVDATTGDLLKEISWTVHCSHSSAHEHSDACVEHNHNHDAEVPESESVVPNSYNVFAWPIESPNFGTRTIEVNPELDNTTASPNGWHQIGTNDFTTTRGNNVDAYLDDDDTNSPTGGDAARTDGGATLDFDFPWTASGAPTIYKDAALTNLFYWTNVTHDVWYNYGFDEQSGNFQEENYTANGAGSDYVQAEAQDGSGSCNANFGTPPDGSNPRMQMYLCNQRDGDFDNGVVVHEIGHGISNRLTGGPAASGCLGNEEQMGEGWSDYFGTVMTIEPGDAGTDSRPMGTWLFEQGPNGGGIRPFPYSTDMNVNPMTYNTINSVSVPHGVGSVWCTMLWDMTWAFIDEYGFDPDIYNGTGGNNMAMALVIEALKLQPCSPGFVDGRDAIIAADQAINGGIHECMIWEVFAARGLGFSASQGSSGSRSDGSEAFDLPPSCSIGLDKTTNVSAVNAGGQIVYTLTATNNTGATLTNVVISDDLPDGTTFSGASNGGSLSGNTVSFPGVTLANSATHTVNFTVNTDGGLDGNVPDFSDNMESGTANWAITNTGGSSWGIQSGSANSGTNAWFAADVGAPSIANLDFAVSVGLTNQSLLRFTHSYDTEATWDGGLVLISTDDGGTWADLGSAFTSNGYNSTINNSTPGFSGNSNGFITSVVNLATYAGQNVIIRFQMNCDQAVAGNGWFIDDVVTTNLALYIPNKASVTDGTLVSTGILATPTLINATPAISFLESSSSTNESAANVANGCLDYVEIPVTVRIGSAPSSPATVTFAASGTATNSIIGDYTISPTSVVLDANNLQRSILLRVYNDGYEEADESITLSYTVNANGGNAVAGIGNQTHQVTIFDDDYAPASGTSTVSILTNDFESGLAFATSNPSGDTPFQSADAGTASSGSFVVPSSNGSQFAYVNDDGCNCDMNEVNMETSSIDLSSAVSAALSFDTYYRGLTYQGNPESAELFIATNGGTPALVATLTGQNVWRNEVIDLSAFVGNSDVQITFRYSDGTGWLYGWAIDNVTVSAEVESEVHTAVNTGNGDEQYFGPNSTVHFYDPTTNNVMLTLQNNTSHDYGCTSVEVDRAGTPAAREFVNADPSTHILAKTFTIVPDNNSTNGNYTVTTYYSEQEVAAWEAATGANRNAAQTLKVSGASNNISDVTPANSSNYTITGMPTTVGALGADVTFASTYSTGFSGFGVGPANALPVELLGFTGQQTSEDIIELKWTTIAEYNNDYFELEHATADASEFSAIYKTAGAGTSNETIDYSYLDRGFSESANYYRLKQVDFDGTTTYSDVVLVDIKAPKAMTVYPNPAQDKAQISFTGAWDGEAQGLLYNALGQLVQTIQLNPTEGATVELDLNNLPSGTYLLKVGTEQSIRVIKE